MTDPASTLASTPPVGDAAPGPDPSLAHRVLDHASVGIAAVGADDLRLILANPAFRTISEGWDRTAGDALPGAGLAGAEHVRTVVASGEPLRIAELPGPAGADGGRTWWCVEYVSIPGTGAPVGSVLILVRDVTEQVRTRERLEAAAAEAEARAREAEEGRRILDAIMEHAPEGITIADAPDATIRRVSRYGRELLGRPAEQLEGIPGVGDTHSAAWGIFRPDGVTRARDADLPLTRAVVGGEVSTSEEWILERPDGSRITILTNAGPIRDGAGNITGGVIAWRDISRRKQYEEERERLLRSLKRERERLGRVFEQAPAAILITVGREHRIESANAAARRLAGGRALVGRPAREAFPEMEAQGFFALMDGVLDTGEAYVGREVPARFGTGDDGAADLRYLDFVFEPLRDEGEEVFGLLTHAVDVTDRVLARRELEDANRAKVRFLASMSHELRTPLNAIAGYVDLLELGVHGPVTGAQQEALTRIAANQRHLLGLIDDVLSFAKVEAGRVEFHLRPLDADAVMQSIEPLVGHQAQAKGIALTIIRSHEDLRCIGDEERVRQVLLNLTSNAVKFTPAGGRISLSCDASERHLHFRVRDSGSGIAPDQHRAIFDPFVQVDRRLDRPQDGVGLGLAISRDLSRGMGGEITVESDVGAGSTFTLTLPRAPRVQGDGQPPLTDR